MTILNSPSSPEQAQQISDARQGLNELNSEIKKNTTNLIRNTGETLENIGDATTVAGGAVTPVAPEIGVPAMGAGSTIAKVGVGLQAAADMREGKLKDAGTRIAIEVVGGAASNSAKKEISKAKLDELGRHTKGTEQAVTAKVDILIEATQSAAQEKLLKSGNKQQ